MGATENLQRGGFVSDASCSEVSIGFIMALLWGVLGVATMSALATNVRLKNQGRRETINKRGGLKANAEAKV
jgi:hypothetical protein